MAGTSATTLATALSMPSPGHGGAGLEPFEAVVADDEERRALRAEEPPRVECGAAGDDGDHRQPRDERGEGLDRPGQGARVVRVRGDRGERPVQVGDDARWLDRESGAREGEGAAAARIRC